GRLEHAGQYRPRADVTIAADQGTCADDGVHVDHRAGPYDGADVDHGAHHHDNVVADLDLLPDHGARLNTRIHVPQVEHRDCAVAPVILEMVVLHAPAGRRQDLLHCLPFTDQDRRTRARRKRAQVCGSVHVELTLVTHVARDGRTLAGIRDQVTDLLVIHSAVS